MDDLTQRKQQILRAVVLEYVETAEPVGSSLLVERYQFGVGTATVRHELSEMADRGYLDQPHTSAGRIPSDFGYRYYVNRLAERAMDPSLERRVKQISHADTDLHGLLLETCKVLSRLTRHVSIATAYSDQSARILSIEFAGITKERVLMTVVLRNGLVENRILEGNGSLTLADLHQLSVEFSKSVSDLPLKSLGRKQQPPFEGLSRQAQPIAVAAWKALRGLVRAATSGRIVSEGTHYLFEQPEFKQDIESLSGIVGALENELIVHEALETSSTRGHISIGIENPSEALHALAIVAGRFFIGESEAGTIAVVGPKRMRYSAVIPLVETAAQALSEALTRLMR
jgi:heat-inducible transcriptional repressor